jgi:raffinose/stachyose/melibiose transport system substrate-binding protein
MTKRWLGAVLPLAVAIGIAGCGGTPGQSKPNQSSAAKSNEAVKTSGFDSLGPVTLKVVSSEGSGGPRDAIKTLTKQFEAKYPNVTVKLSFRDFSSWIKQAKLAASSDSAPDVFAGNQGYQLDGELVKAGLILPLDKYAKAYGWDKSYTPETMQQFEWSNDGHTFGSGTLWGVAQSGQSTGVFVNLAKLKQAGIDLSSLKTFDDFDAALAKLRGTLPASEPVIALGNKDQYGALHMWGMVQGAYEPAQAIRDWIFHKDGATFDTKGNLTSLEKIKQWADKGYLGKGDAFNSLNDAEAAAAFGKGKGVFLLGGNWNASIVKAGLGKDGGFVDMPPGSSGKAVAIGSTSTPLHVSAKTKQPDLAAAYIDFITGPTAAQALVDTQQVPAATDATAKPGDPLGQQVMQGWQKLVEEGGLTLYPDWSSPTMLQTMGQTFQEMLADRMSPQDVIKKVQKDWDDYHQELGNG